MCVIAPPRGGKSGATPHYWRPHLEELIQLQHEPHEAYVERYRLYIIALRTEADRAATACRDANNAWFRACREARDAATVAALARTRGRASRAAGLARGLVDIHSARFFTLLARGR